MKKGQFPKVEIKSELNYIGIVPTEKIQKDLDEKCSNAKGFFCSVCNKHVKFFHCTHSPGKLKQWGD